MPRPFLTAACVLVVIFASPPPARSTEPVIRYYATVFAYQDALNRP